MSATPPPISIPQDLAQALLTYLSTQPWAEVNTLIQRLHQAATQDSTPTDG